MFYALLKTLHLLSVIVWLGGMFFSLFCLRQGVHGLPAEQRIAVMVATLGRFFQAVSVASVLVLLSGAGMMGLTARATRQTGAAFNAPLEWLVMAVLGAAMVMVFGHLRFALFKRLGRAQARGELALAAATLQSIRAWVAINLVMGVVIVVVVMAGTVA